MVMGSRVTFGGGGRRNTYIASITIGPRVPVNGFLALAVRKTSLVILALKPLWQRIYNAAGRLQLMFMYVTMDAVIPNSFCLHFSCVDRGGQLFAKV